MSREIAVSPFRNPLCLSAILAAFSAIYLWQAAPVLQWGDPAKLLSMAASGSIDFLGPGSHGLLILSMVALDRILPGGIETAARLSSPISSILTLTILWRVFRKAGIGLEGRALALVAIGISHLFWSVAEVVESYSLLGLCFAVWMWAAQAYIVRPSAFRALCLLIVLGIGILNHQLFLMIVPVQFAYFLFTLKGRPWKTWLALHVLIGGMAVLGLALNPEKTQAALKLTWYSIDRWVLPTQGLRLVWLLPVLFLFQFPGPPFLFGILGIRSTLSGSGSGFPRLLAIILAVISLFAISYGIGRGVYLLLPAYLSFAVLAGLGWERWIAGDPNRRKRFVPVLIAAFVIPIAGYCLAWQLCNRLKIYPVSGRIIAQRDPNRYYLWPGKRGEDGPERFVREIATLQEPEALVLSDFRISTVLNYAKDRDGYDFAVYETDGCAFLPLEEVRSTIFGKIDAAHQQGKGVILADVKSVEFYLRDRRLYDLLPELESRYRVEKAGSFHRIAPLRPDSGLGRPGGS